MRRQMRRAQLAAMHNKRVMDAGTGDVWDVRTTDVNEALCRRRYQVGPRLGLGSQGGRPAARLGTRWRALGPGSAQARSAFGAPGARANSLGPLAAQAPY